ncbi:RES family NAD+ phosphorylase [Ewingella americana]|uniref:RES family NAD+ phosphorylase n=1 Tax=Ewingella americana TaxID=41202 RepID=UPI0012AE0A81|nr:RES family NAD+ phosphorylase [Ewingella americana]MRT04156.1 RES domain-containing protein [Ewingella americana]
MAENDNKDDVKKSRKLPVPKPCLDVNFTTWPAGRPFHRIHSKKFRATEFNLGKGNARFSPMSNGIATLYGAESCAVAVMETFFHDLPTSSQGAPFDLANLDGLVHSIIKAKTDLYLADLNPRTLRKMGVSRADLLDSSADHYIFTREYSLAIHRQYPDAHGLMWSSKQHGGTAMMLFGDRILVRHLQAEIESASVAQSEKVIETIEVLADELGLVLLPSGGGY